MREPIIAANAESFTMPSGETPANSQFSLLIDWEHLHQISDRNEEFEMELLQIFVEDAKQHLADMETAIATADYQNLEHQAHHIRGSSGNLGIFSMYKIATELEVQARQQHLDGALQRFTVLKEIMGRVKQYLEEWEIEMMER